MMSSKNIFELSRPWAMSHQDHLSPLMELKLNPNTFEWQKFSQKSADIPHYSKLLEFLNLCTQACETCTSDTKKVPRSDIHTNKRFQSNKPIASFTASTLESVAGYILCKLEKHPLYACPRFKVLPHDNMMSII